MADVSQLVDEFVSQLRRRQVQGSLSTARRTAELLRQVISHQRYPSNSQRGSDKLLEVVKSVGLRLIAANPSELAIGNMVRRVLHIIREEDASLAASSDSSDYSQVSEGEESTATAVAAANRSVLRAPSLHNLLESVPGGLFPAGEEKGLHVELEANKSKIDPKNPRVWRLKNNTIEGVNELLYELDNFHSQVADQAIEHIHQNEVILTIGRSRTTLNFFLEAKKKRNFQVVVSEGAPRYDGHILANELTAGGIQTTVITDSAVFAMMARMNLVVVASHAMMANGGAVASIGTQMVALAAQRHAVPFVMLSGIFKLCPLFPQNPSTVLDELKSPSDVLRMDEFSDCLDDTGNAPRLKVVNPTFDYIPPELVSIFITDTGGHNPSYVYRLLAEFYSQQDYEL